MNEDLTALLVIISAFCLIFYLNKWELMDMTGLAKKSAIKKMDELADSLSMNFEAGRTIFRQGELTLKTKRYEIKILPDHNRISISFNKQTGIYLLNHIDQRKNLRPSNLSEFKFKKSKLNTFFTEQLSRNDKATINFLELENIEEILLKFVNRWDGRKLSGFALRDDTLHIIFSYRNYLPINLMSEVTPLIMELAKIISAKK